MAEQHCSQYYFSYSILFSWISTCCLTWVLHDVSSDEIEWRESFHVFHTAIEGRLLANQRSHFQYVILIYVIHIERQIWRLKPRHLYLNFFVHLPHSSCYMDVVCYYCSCFCLFGIVSLLLVGFELIYEWTMLFTEQCCHHGWTIMLNEQLSIYRGCTYNTRTWENMQYALIEHLFYSMAVLP